MSCSDNLLNNDCLIINSRKLLANKRLRWVIYQFNEINNPKIEDVDGLKNYLKALEEKNIVPYISLQSFKPEFEYDINYPNLKIIDGFIMSPTNLSFSFTVETNGICIILFDKIDNLINYSNIQDNQVIMSENIVNSYKTSKNIKLNANQLYRISFIVYQKTNTLIKFTMYKSFFNTVDIDDSLFFSYATNSAINNTLSYSVNSTNLNVLNNYLKWDFYSNDTFENIDLVKVETPPSSLELFLHNPLDLKGLKKLNERYFMGVSLYDSKIKDIAPSNYFKYIISGYIQIPFNITLNIKVTNGYLVVYAFPLSDLPFNNILDVTNSTNLIFASGNTDSQYNPSKTLSQGYYRFQLIYTSGNADKEDSVGFDIKYSTTENNNSLLNIPLNWFYTDYFIDTNNLLESAILENCNSDNLTESNISKCIDAINNQFLELSTNRSQNFLKHNGLDKIDTVMQIKDFQSKPDDKCFDENNILNDYECLLHNGTNKYLYQRYKDICTASENNLNSDICIKFSNMNHVNLYDDYCTKLLSNNKKMYLNDNNTYNLCRSNISQNLQNDLKNDLNAYCLTEDKTNLNMESINDPICSNLSNYKKFATQTCFNSDNINTETCQNFILNPENMGYITDEIIQYCNNYQINNSDLNTNLHTNICKSFYNEDQTNPILKNDYYRKLVNECSDLDNPNNFSVPNSTCYNIANDTKIDKVTNKSPFSYFLKNMLEYCSRGTNILSSTCQYTYKNLKQSLKLNTSTKSNFNNKYNNRSNNLIDFYNDNVIIILFILSIIITIFIIKQINKKYQYIYNNQNMAYYFIGRI